MITSNKSEIQKNRDTLKKTKRMDQLLFVAYLLTCFGTFLYSSMGTLTTLVFSAVSIFIFIFGVIASVAVFFLGYLGLYRKEIIYSALAPVVALTASIACSGINATFGHDSFLGTVGAFNLAMTIFTSLFMVLNMENIRTFNYIKEQPGYPYFNELIEKQKEERYQNSIKTEYESTYERITQNKVKRLGNNRYAYEKSGTQPTTMDEI